ncbi:MAG TPA: FmdB family zinc ribbon protein [Candidatus Limnocylindrales bacterium]|nr:FmdB family zinc ribbon protein [Candidatus Limnocylindrales bacterium]
MPAYDYTCARCGHLTEVVHGIHASGPTICPSCGAEGTMRKGFAAPAVHFKGSGWAKKDRSASSSSSKGKSSKSGEASAATPAAEGAAPAASSTPAASTADGGD